MSARVVSHSRETPRWREIDKRLSPQSDIERNLVASAPAYSGRGWSVVALSDRLHGAMVRRFFEVRYVYNAFVPEDTHGMVHGHRTGASLVAGGHASGDPWLKQHHEAGEIRDLVQAHWGLEVEPTYWYGPRQYLSGAVMERHVDRPLTHILSATVCIEKNTKADWPIFLDTSDGFVEIELEPGEALLYEGVRFPHFRPFPLEGEYVGAFFHYRPAGFRATGQYQAAIDAAVDHDRTPSEAGNG